MDHLPSADPADIDSLRSVGWIDSDSPAATRLFDRLRSGADPEGAIRRLGDLGQTHPNALTAALADERVGDRLVALAGGSRALFSALATATAPVGILRGDVATDPDPEDLARWVREALASVAAADLAGDIDMPEAARRVSSIADTATSAATTLATRDSSFRLAVIAMGKWGGCELNYASDIDLLFVHEGPNDPATAAAGHIVDLLNRRTPHGQAFRVDAGLRPEGSSGPLSRTLTSYRTYWSRWADTWEFQALLKARLVAGDPALGAEFLEAAAGFVFPEQLGADAVRSIRAMKHRSEEAVGAETGELKRGAGGIRDVEFAVQMLQLVHGRANPKLRSPNTLEALQRLAGDGYVLGEDAATLDRAYRWLRDAEHRIQLYDLRQTHSLPDPPAERERIGRAMGYRDSVSGSALEAFEADLTTHTHDVRSIHERLFHRPVLEALAESKVSAMPPEAAARRLAAFGFLDTEATRSAIADLTKGLSRRSRLMRHMLPLVMEWLSRSPDPDLGLAQLRRLTSTTSVSSVVAILRDDPPRAQRLCTVLGTSRFVGELLRRIPQLIPLVGDDAALATTPSRPEMLDEVLGRSAVGRDPTAALRRFHAEHMARIAIADLSCLIDEIEVGERLSDLCEATVGAALTLARRDLGFDLPICVVAMGKWGGRELNYASDLDAVVVMDDRGDAAKASKVIERVISMLGEPAADLRSLEIDLDLRPEGRKGALVRSLSSFEAYYRQWAETWEFQAMLRARPAAGDLDLGERLVSVVFDIGKPGDGTLKPMIRKMKARIERERIPIGEDPDFHLKLGKGGMSDVEWTAQLLQLQHMNERPGLRTPSTLAALTALAEDGLLDAAEAVLLESAYRYCAKVRNRMFLRDGRRRDALPDDPLEATRLARSLGYSWAPRTNLREDYRRATRRARRVVELRFYGIDAPPPQSGSTTQTP